MRWRRCRHWLLPIALWASLVARNGMAQTSSLPPAIDDRPAASPLARQSPLGAASDLFAQAAPPTPLPIPGPAGVGFPVGGMDAVVPEGLPINLAAAMQLSGVRPLDIAAAMAQVQQALALQLQAKALWIPTLNGGVTYFRHDGVQQDIFTGPNFRKGLQSFFVGGGPSLFVGLTDAIFSPLAARRWSPRGGPTSRPRGTMSCSRWPKPISTSRRRGEAARRRGDDPRAELLVNFNKGLAPALIAPLEINRALAELQSLRQSQQIAIRDWRVASARLAEVLLLDPATLLEPVEPPFLQMTFVPSERSPEELLPIALNSRPEIASRQELVAAATLLLQREK